MAHQLRPAKLAIARQYRIIADCDGIVAGQYAVDPFLEGEIIVEPKAIKALDNVHTADVSTTRRRTAAGPIGDGRAMNARQRVRDVDMDIGRGLLCLALMSLGPITANGANLGPGEAQNHIGETATVCGTVESAHYAERSAGQPTFLNLGHPYPKQDFTVVIWGDDRRKFGTPEAMAGQRICVTGPIELYRGKPEIVLQDPSELTR